MHRQTYVYRRLYSLAVYLDVWDWVLGSRIFDSCYSLWNRFHRSELSPTIFLPIYGLSGWASVMVCGTDFSWEASFDRKTGVRGKEWHVDFFGRTFYRDLFEIQLLLVRSISLSNQNTCVTLRTCSLGKRCEISSISPYQSPHTAYLHSGTLIVPSY